MKIIKTKSFELAALIKGNENSDKLFLLLPGRLDTKDYANFESHLDYFAKMGFLVIAFDPPGTWESPGKIGLFTTTNYIKAVNELIEYFNNRPTLLLGHSRGGAVSILVAKENPNVIGIITVMLNLGVSTPPDSESIKRGYKISYRDFPPGTHKTEKQKEFNLPITYFNDGEKYDPVVALKQLKKPKMILFGDKDEFLSPEEVEKIYQEVPEPKIVKKLESTHNYRYYPEVITEVNELVYRFVNDFFRK
jgi:pimeloyl-ACP methyl ester carboxylesterase